MENSELVTACVCAAMLDIKVGTLNVWRCRKRYALPFVKIGKSVKYKRSDIEKFIASRTFSGVDPDPEARPKRKYTRRQK